MVKLTNKEKLEFIFAMLRIKEVTHWEDIKVGFKYHVPPLAGQDRFNIYIMSKNDSLIRYMRIGETPSYSKCMLKTDLTYKFLTEINE